VRALPPARHGVTHGGMCVLHLTSPCSKHLGGHCSHNSPHCRPPLCSRAPRDACGDRRLSSKWGLMFHARTTPATSLAPPQHFAVLFSSTRIPCGREREDMPMGWLLQLGEHRQLICEIQYTGAAGSATHTVDMMSARAFCGLSGTPRTAAEMAPEASISAFTSSARWVTSHSGGRFGLAGLTEVGGPAPAGSWVQPPPSRSAALPLPRPPPTPPVVSFASYTVSSLVSVHRRGHAEPRGAITIGRQQWWALFILVRTSKRARGHGCNGTATVTILDAPPRSTAG